MQKKAVIDTVFIYAISALIIILVVYFGYRGISGIQKANEESVMQKLQLKLDSDLGKLSINYGTAARLTYDIASGYQKVCFVDLHLNETAEAIRNQMLQNYYPLIWDSVETGSPNNVFALGEKVLAIETGKLKVKCPPYVYCANATRGKIDFFAEGGGDSVIIIGNDPAATC